MAGRTIWYCYQLNEKVNKHGNPYIGKTKDLIRRSKEWKIKLKLDYIPVLIILHTDTSEQRIFDYEQERRVANGWPRERSLRHQVKMRKKANEGKKNSIKLKDHCKKIAKIYIKNLGIKNALSGHLDDIRTKESTSKGGKICMNKPDAINKIRCSCIYCRKESIVAAISRWHGNNCKLKNDL